jgi:LPS-assembly lipoprotein
MTFLAQKRKQGAVLVRGRRVLRSAKALAALLIAASTAACFQPLYSDRSITGGPGIHAALRGVDVSQIAAPSGSAESRIAVELRNALLFGITGGDTAAPPTHRLDIKMVTSRTSVIVDIVTARPDLENYGINAAFVLVDLRTGKVVVKDQTFARVSYDVPGQQQRFARQRGLRDAENRAAQTIADNIRSRLASYFVAGT